MSAPTRLRGARLEQLVEQIPGAVYVIELAEGEPPRPLYVSPRIEEILGLTIDEFDTQPGHGTTFHVRLPVAGCPTEAREVLA
jgi:PAS domain-containing protein